MKTLLFLLVYIGFGFAQTDLPNPFTHIASHNDGGKVLAVEGVGTIFTTNPDGGLSAYRFDGTSFINTASIYEGGGAEDLAIGNDGTIFLTSSGTGGGLRAYSYDGSSFVNKGHAYAGNAYQVCVGLDGTIFIQYFMDKIRMYSHDGNSFTKINEFGCDNNIIDLAVGPDSTLYVAVDGELKAYRYHGSSIANIANYIPQIGVIFGVKVGLDGTIFLTCGGGGLYALRCENETFVNKAHISCNEDSDLGPLTIGLDQTVFVTEMPDWGGNPRPQPRCGLYAYSYHDSSFIQIGHDEDICDVSDIAVGPDGTIFIASGDSISAYKYSGYTNINKKSDIIPLKYELSQNFPNPFNPRTTIEFSLPKTEFTSLKIYNLLGQEVATLVSDKLNAGGYKYNWDATGMASGLYYYRLVSGEFAATKKLVVLN